MAEYDPINKPHPLLLKDAKLLLSNDYLPFEGGHAVNGDGMHHIAANTYMRNVTGKMIDWWFGFIHHTEDYLLWHPRDHVFSDWEGPRNNDSTYVGGHHLVHEYIGKDMQKLAISFRDPGFYFGEGWKEEFEKNGYATAICARVSAWDDEQNTKFGLGHVIHLVKTEPDGCRMRSRFWLGDLDLINGMELAKTPEERAALVNPDLTKGLLKHASEEMAILATQLPDLYRKHSKGNTSSI